MKKFIIALSFLSISLFSNILTAQEICKISGIVVDSLNIGLYNVSITVYDTDGKGNGFTYTDKSGHFNLQLQCNQKGNIHIEALGFKSQVIPVDAKQMSEQVKFVLSDREGQIDEVIVKARVPIKMKGDTIEFDAVSFQTGNEENLEDVLKKLPGIKIDNGKVYYEGKEIKNFTVEGREIFGGNMKLVNKNLPSGAISKVQIDKKFKKNPFANSLQQDDDFSLNIVLKEDKKSLVFGNVSAGTNFKEHSDLQGKAFYFNPKVDVTVIADSNTYGKEVFTREDMIGFMGGISTLKKEGGQFSLRSNLQPFNLGDIKDASVARTNLGAIHIGYAPNNKLYVNGFALYTGNSLDYTTIVDRLFSDFSFRQNKQESQKLHSGLAQARIDYFPTARSEMRYRAILNIIDNKMEQSIDNSSFSNSAIANLGFQMANTNRNFINFSHNLSYLKKIGKSDNFGIYITHNYQKDTPIYAIESSNPIFNDTFNNQNEENGMYKIRQAQATSINTVQVYSEYNNLITNTFNLKVKLGANFSAQDFTNNIYSNGNLLLENQQKADARLSYKEYYADLNLTKSFANLKFDLGGSLSRFDEANIVVSQQNSRLEKVAFLPHLTLKYEWNIAKTLTLDYKKTFSYPEIKELSNTYQVQNTYLLFLGNPYLDREINHRLKLAYRYSRYTSFFNFYSEFSFNLIKNSIQTTSLFNVNTQLDSNVNNHKNAYSYLLNFNMDKKINKFWTIKLEGNFSINEFYTQTNSLEDNSTMLYLIKNDIAGNNLVWANTFKIKKRFEFGLGLSYTNNKYKVRNEATQLLLKNNFETWSNFVDASFVVTEKFLFKAHYSYEKQTNNKKYLNEYNDLSFSIRYKLFRQTYLELVAANLLDNRLVSNTFDSNYSQIVIKNRLSAYYLLGIKYKF